MIKKVFFQIALFICFILYGELAMAKLNLIAKSFSAPTAIAFDSQGSMYVTNWSGSSIEKITTEGKRNTIYNNISSPAGIVIDKQDNIYVSSYSGNFILQITQDGKVEKISTDYHTPTGIAFSNTGELLITNRSSGEVVALDLTTKQKKVVAKGLSLPVGVTQLADNRLVVSQYSGRLTLIEPNGKQIELGSAFNQPGVGIVSLSPSEVAVIDNGAGAVRKVDVNSKSTTTLVTSLSGAVALSLYKNQLYIGTWGDESVYQLTDINP